MFACPVSCPMLCRSALSASVPPFCLQYRSSVSPIQSKLLQDPCHACLVLHSPIAASCTGCVKGEVAECIEDTEVLDHTASLICDFQVYVAASNTHHNHTGKLGNASPSDMKASCLHLCCYAAAMVMEAILPGFCAASLIVIYGPIVEVRQLWEGADECPPVLLSCNCDRVAPEIQAAKLRQLCQVAKRLRGSKQFSTELQGASSHIACRSFSQGCLSGFN